jgi:hypothetical protein
MSSWTGERLRRAAVEAIGPHADERTRDALARGTMTIVPAAMQWESSTGRMLAHRVSLFLDAGRIGAIRSTPAVEDALRAAVAAAVSSQPSETLEELVLRWSPRPSSMPNGSTAYRDAPPAPIGGAELLREALVEYLDGSGDAALARRTADAEITILRSGGIIRELRVNLPRQGRDPARAKVRETAALTRALRDLLGESAARVVVRAAGC